METSPLSALPWRHGRSVWPGVIQVQDVGGPEAADLAVPALLGLVYALLPFFLSHLTTGLINRLFSRVKVPANKVCSCIQAPNLYLESLRPQPINLNIIRKCCEIQGRQIFISKITVFPPCRQRLAVISWRVALIWDSQLPLSGTDSRIRPLLNDEPAKPTRHAGIRRRWYKVGAELLAQPAADYSINSRNFHFYLKADAVWFY